MFVDAGALNRHNDGQGEKQGGKQGERQGERKGKDPATGADRGERISLGVTLANGRSCASNRLAAIAAAGVTGTPAACSALATQTLQVLNTGNRSRDA